MPEIIAQPTLLDIVLQQPVAKETLLDNILALPPNAWAVRPPDTRYAKLDGLLDTALAMRQASRVHVLAPEDVVFDVADDRLVVDGVGEWAEFTNFSFGQMCQRLKSPAGFLRELTPSLTAQVLTERNAKVAGKGDRVKLMTVLRDGQRPLLQAATGPKYGRIWYADTIGACKGLLQEFPDWHFWKGSISDRDIDVTLLYHPDADAFEAWSKAAPHAWLKNDSDSQFMRGIRIRNSEVGYTAYTIEAFFVAKVCNNGAIIEGDTFKHFSLRHSVNAPARFASEVGPQLAAFARAEFPIEKLHQRLAEYPLPILLEPNGKSDVELIQAQRPEFSVGEIASARYAALHEGNREWKSYRDLYDGLTACARDYDFADAATDLQRRAGALLTSLAN